VLFLVTWYGGTRSLDQHTHPQYLSTPPQWSISQKALETLPEEGNVMPKHVVATIHN
jgi:hypothetical protein